MSKPNDPTNTRYKPLADHLANLGGKPITITLSDIEEILGNPLPDTARGDRRQQWWGNDPTHTQADNGWMKAGYSTVNAAKTLPDAISFVQTTSSEKAYSFDELSKLFHKHFRMSRRNYREVAARTLLDAADLTDVKGKQIRKNIEKLNSILPPELQGQDDIGVALEMCREQRGRNVGIVYNKAKDSYSLALSKDATEEQKKELKGICGRYITKLHFKRQNPSGNEINNLEEFKSIILEGEGFIAITDNSNQDRIHSAACDRVKEDNFVEKMVTNKGKNGMYTWYPTKATAQKANPDAEGCTKCGE